MHDFSPSSMLALMMANRLATVSLISLIVAIVIAALNWDKVSYFIRRVWHCVPVIGTVSRWARQIKRDNSEVDESGWRSGEIALCEEYLNRYQSVDKDPTYFEKCQDYLSKVSELGRRTSPGWVLPLMGALLVLEAVGFAYVIGPWMNRDASSNDLQYLTWSMAAFLALISGFFAHIAGHQIHHNSLIKKARHWWRGTASAERDGHIGKDIQPITIDNTHDDDKAAGYNKILARIKANETVTPKYLWVAVFVGTIVFVAIAAFWVRTEQLNALETDLVAGYQVSQTGSVANSPFDLPAASADIEKQSHEKTFDDKMGAEHRASLVTFSVLSVVYVALQCIALWLAMVFGFAGRSSKEAYDVTSKFKTANDMVRWMERERAAIRGHATHKLRLLQKKVSGFDMTSNTGHNSSTTAGARDFDAFLSRTAAKEEEDRKEKQAKAMEKELAEHREKLELQRSKDNIDAEYRSPAPTRVAPVAPVAAVPQQAAPEEAVKVTPAPEPAVAPEPAPQAQAPQAAAVKAGDFDDIREIPDDEIQHLVEAYGLPLDQLQRIKAAQITLAKIGKFPALKEVTA